jgi:hypothetical protein
MYGIVLFIASTVHMQSDHVSEITEVTVRGLSPSSSMKGKSMVVI